MAADRKAGGGSQHRLNIYLPNADLRLRVKEEAARTDVTISEFCVEAIRSALRRAGREPEAPAETKRESAAERARRFQAEAFRGRVFEVSSAELIRDARRSPPAAE